MVGLIGATLSLVVGCGGDEDEPAASDPGTTVTPDTGPVDDSSPPSRPGASDLVPATGQAQSVGTPRDPTEVLGPLDESSSLVATAVHDLADHLGVATDAVTVTSAEAVVWGDGSYGCPRPGMVYAQVLTDGVLIVLEADGTSYRYHGGSPPFRCG